MSLALNFKVGKGVFPVKKTFLLEKLGLFQENPSLLSRSEYKVQTRVPLRVFTVFISAVQGGSFTLSEGNCGFLRLLAEEFRFKELSVQCSAFFGLPYPSDVSVGGKSLPLVTIAVKNRSRTFETLKSRRVRQKPLLFCGPVPETGALDPPPQTIRDLAGQSISQQAGPMPMPPPGAVILPVPWSSNAIGLPPVDDIHLGIVKVPIMLPSGCVIIRLGQIDYENPEFHTGRYIFPVGFKVQKPYFAGGNKSDTVPWFAEITRDEGRPLFSLWSSRRMGVRFVGRSPSRACQEMLGALRINDFLGGVEMFLLDDPNVAYCIEHMKGADLCQKYVMRCPEPTVTCAASLSDTSSVVNITSSC
jgi:hypothetical protein